MRPPEGAPNVPVRIDLGDDDQRHHIGDEQRMAVAMTQQ
jgi:hypothetical protein